MARKTYKVGDLQKQGENIRKKSVRSRRRNKKVKGTPPLPVNWVDVGVDPFDVTVNEDLAKAIQSLVKAAKSNQNGQRMLIGWRLYPNRDHDDWDNDNDRWKSDPSGHSCGCGCGCGS